MQNENQDTENYDEIIRTWERKNCVNEPLVINTNSSKIIHIPYFPKCVKLYLTLSSDICMYLPDFPSTLKILDITLAPEIIPQLPPNLESLRIFIGDMRELPPLPDSLKKLKIEMTAIRHLPPLPPNLEELSCSENDLVCLPELPHKLKLLECAQNRITRLPALPQSLKELTCMYNKITEYPEYHADLDVIDDRYPGLY